MKNILKNLFYVFIGIFLSGIIVYAANYINGKEVGYDNTSSNLNANNIQDAIDEIYTYTKNNTGKKVYDSSQITMTTRFNDEVNTLKDALDDLYSSFEGE